MLCKKLMSFFFLNSSMIGFGKVQRCLMENKLLRLSYLHNSKGEVHIHVRVEAALLIIPVVYIIIILLRIYWSCFVPVQINKSLLLFYASLLSQIFSNLISQLNRSLLERISLSKARILCNE
jgi:hypothetical protein